MARNQIDPNQLPPLPADISEDLREAFEDKEQNGAIGTVHFKNILHNFGFHSMSKKEIDEELFKRSKIDLNTKKTFTFDEVKNVIAYRLMKAKGIEDEAKECFKLIDLRDRSFITAQDLKTALSANLDVQVTEDDIAEFMEIAGTDNGQLYLNNFMKLYN